MKRKYKLLINLLLFIVGIGFLMQIVVYPKIKNRHYNKIYAFSEKSKSVVDENLQHLPKSYLDGNNYKKQFNKTCRRYPSLSDIHFSNSYWQVLESVNDTDVQILSAYLDNRSLNKNNESVRIIGMINKYVENDFQLYCQLWYESEKDAIVVEANNQFIWIKQWGIRNEYMPYLFTCNIPKAHHNITPLSVSLVNEPCDFAKNNLAVLYDKPDDKKKFAVCVKGLDFLDVDLSLRLIEWIELLLILGVEKIYFYKLEVHPNVEAVLDYYEKIGKVVATPANLPGYHANIPELRHKLLKDMLLKRYFEVALYNDCFYNNMYKYKYISLLDTDEIIIPLKTSNWSSLLDDVEEKKGRVISSYVFQNAYYLDIFENETRDSDDLPEYTYMLRHVHRTQNHTPKGHYIKCFHNTESILTLHNHFPLKCLNGCTRSNVNVTNGHLQHYRRDCYNNLKSCKELKEDVVYDNNLWRFKDVLIKRIEHVLKVLQKG